MLPSISRGFASGPSLSIPTSRLIQSLNIFPREKLQEYERIRRIRNNLVHGAGTVSLDDILEAARQIQELVNTLPNP
jgi:uncharacterized protein YutE (UPF0331/DUF86 family)